MTGIFKSILALAIIVSSCFAQTLGTATLTATRNGQTANVSIALLPSTVLTVAPSVSTLSAVPGTTVTFDLLLSSTCSTGRPTCQQPSGLQVQLQSPAAGVTSFIVTEGAAATAAAKTLSCAPQTVAGQTALKCLLAGLNQTKIANGVIAHVAVSVPLAATGTVTVNTSGFVASNGAGNAMQGAVSQGPTITIQPPVSVSLTCAQLYTEPGEPVTCIAGLSIAPTSAATINLSTDKPTSPGIITPSTVSITANLLTQSFTITGN